MSRRNPSFTLVEMIVAMGVLSILTALLFSVLNETSRITTANMGRTRSTSELRLVVDQMLRELQSAVDDNVRQCFYATNSPAIRMHFLATLDNNSGNEDAEIHYYYNTNEYRLYKNVEFWTVNGALNTSWDADTSTTWYNTPSYPTDYVTVLDNVKSFSIRYTTNEGNWWNHWSYYARASNLPGFVEVSFVYCDNQDVIRYRGVANVPTYLLRTNKAIVYLPRRV